MSNEMKNEEILTLLKDDMSKARSVYSMILNKLFEQSDAQVIEYQHFYRKYCDLAQIVMDYLDFAETHVNQLDAMNTERMEGAKRDGSQE